MRWFLPLMSGLFATSCDGGQSGTDFPLCPPPGISCVCEDLAHGVPIRGVVTAIERGGAESFGGPPRDYVRIRVEEVLAPSAPEIERGVEVGGSWRAGSCGEQTVDVGDTVVAFFGGESPRQCPAHVECVVDRCGLARSDVDLDSSDCGLECLADTADACAAHAEAPFLHGELTLAPLVDGAWDLGGGLVLPAGELDVLLSRSCLERFPPPPSPCDDFRSGGCSSSSSSSSEPGPPPVVGEAVIEDP
jgi:hypothetical protein